MVRSRREIMLKSPFDLYNAERLLHRSGEGGGGGKEACVMTPGLSCYVYQ